MEGDIYTEAGMGPESVKEMALLGRRGRVTIGYVVLIFHM